MANGLDRLEKFFSLKRKASTVSTEPSTAPSSEPGSPTVPSADLSFPSPSFIRPKTSRMAAREERPFRQLALKSPSTTDVSSSPVREMSFNSLGSSNTAATRRLRLSRTRSSSSLGSQQCAQLSVVFHGFEFPRPPPSRQGESAPSCSAHGSKPLPELPKFHDESRPCSPFQMEVPISRVDTPPSSDREDSPSKGRAYKPKKLIITPFFSPPTPQMSPELGPCTDWQIQDKQPVDVLGGDLCDNFQPQLDLGLHEWQYDDIGSRPSSKSSTDSYASTGVFTESAPTSSLNEPGFDDFFSLSDDNVAEFQFEDDEDGSVKVASSVSPLPFCNPPLLTLEPPSASRPATAAAFEAARIAGRYNFDMLYVVNLWPEESYTGTPSQTQETSPPNMTGRLLAAYGLHHGPSPFQISSDVHGEVLRSDGWLEYRDEKALGAQFSRAYACAFYPGRFEQSSSSALSESDSFPDADKDSIDRGIVFAAYRKPRADGTVQYSTPTELALLQRDVETMVEVLIDVHVASQLRQSPILTQYADDTGPIPIIYQP